jgi:hypothetical protein
MMGDGEPPNFSLQKTLSSDRVFCLARMSGLRQGTVDGAEGIADLGTKQTHDSNYNDGDERENNRVFDEALAFFFGCKQHGIIPF